MKKFDVTKTKAFILIGAFATCIPVFNYFDVPFPKVAWAADLEKLEEQQLETTIDLYQRELSRQRYEKLRLEREQERIKESSGEVPDSYLKEQEYLETDIEEIGNTVEKARNQLINLK